MQKFRFLDWKVYKDSKELLTMTLKLIKKIPKAYRFELCSQLIRSAFSVVLNIAEGSGKSSDKELNRYLNIALGSLYELLAGVDVLKDNSFIADGEFKIFFEKVDNISNQLGGFKKKLKS